MPWATLYRPYGAGNAAGSYIELSLLKFSSWREALISDAEFENKIRIDFIKTLA
jgi:hypothetical protein